MLPEAVRAQWVDCGGLVPAMVAGPCVPTADLDLTFMAPGLLDPRLTFTRASTGTYFNSAGVMQTAAINTPRWDYDPVTLALRGLLIEEARTNSIRNSTMAGAVPGTPGTLPTNWALNAGTTGLSSQVVGTGTEDGIAYLDFRIFGTAAAASQYQLLHETTTAIAALTGQAWSFAQNWRLVGGTANGITLTQFTIRECTAAGATVRENLVTAVLPTAAALRTQRYTQSVTFSGGGTVGATHTRLVVAVASGAAIDITLRIGAPQLELGAFPTSYIATTSAAVTRAADVATVPTTGWFNPAASSLMAAFVVPSNATSVNRDPCGITDGTVSNRLSLRAITLGTGIAGTVTSVAGVHTSSTTLGVVAQGVTTKMAAAWNGTAAVGTLNGAAVVSTAVGMPGTLNVLCIGNFLAGGADYLSGWMQRVSYWNRVLTDAEMQALTS
jgi:hypothetical protein